MTEELRKNLDSRGKQVAPIAKAFQEAVDQMRPTMRAISEATEKFRREYGPIIKQFAEIYGPKIQEFAVRAEQWQKDQKVSVTLLAEHGWFPSWYTFFYSPPEDIKSIDDLMINHIDESWAEIKQKIIKLSPNREHILKVAFELHEEEQLHCFNTASSIAI